VSEDRFEIIEVLAETHMGIERAALDPAVLAGAVARTDGWVGRDLQGLCITAKSLIDGGLDDGRPMAPSAAILSSLDLILPSKKDMAEQIGLALAFTSDLRFMPEEWRTKARSQAAATPTEFADNATENYEPANIEAARSTRRRKGVDL